MLTCIKMYSAAGTPTGSTQGFASIDVPTDMQLLACQWNIEATDATGAYGQIEASLSSTSGITTNDTRSSFSAVSYQITGASQVAITHYQQLPQPLRLLGGDRVFLHANNAGAFDILRCTLFLYCDAKEASGRARRL